MKLSFVLAALAAVAAAAPAYGDDARRGGGPAPGAEDRADTIGIEDLIGVAVRRSPELARVRSERRAGRSIARAGASGEPWRIGASVEWLTGTAARVPGNPVQQVGQTSVVTSLTTSKRLPTGGEIEVSLSDTRLYQRFAVARTEGDETAEAIAHVGVAQVAVIQPLLRGRGSVSRADRRRAELEGKRAEAQSGYNAAKLVHDLVVSYWEVAYAAEVIDVRKDSLKAANEQLVAARGLSKEGVLPLSALKAAEYGVAVREEALLRATIELEDRSLATRQRAGLEVGPDDIALRPVDELALDADDYEMGDVLAVARQKSPRIAAARVGVDVARVDMDVANDALVPAVDLRFRAASVGGGPAFGDALEGVGNAEAYELSAGVSVAYELGGGIRQTADAARAIHAAAEVDVEVVTREVIATAVKAVHRVRAARARAEVAAKAIEVAAINVKAEQVAFRAGRTTSYQVLERLRELDEARLLRARAIADYHQAVAAVELEAGAILDRWGVELRDRRK